MSDDELTSSLSEDSLQAEAQINAVERKLHEIKIKKADIDLKRVTYQHEQMVKDDHDLEAMKTMSLDGYSGEQVAALVKKNEEYIDAAKTRFEFILPDFDDIVPFFRKNLILIGASTGSGKSTCVANIVNNLIRQERDDGTQCRALVLTNEETAEDFYNRITALAMGINYANHDKITESEKKIYSKNIELLAGSGLVTVVDDNYGGLSGVTTTIEGIESLLENIVRNNVQYDCILLDYYQNVKSSKRDPLLVDWQVQGKLAALLDRYKNILPCPVVILAQVNKLADEDDTTPFEVRIKGRKVITDPCTLIMEIQREHADSRTKWIVHKSRYTGAVGGELYTGFSKGAYVPYTDEFIKMAAQRREKFIQNETDAKTGKAFNEKAAKQ